MSISRRRRNREKGQGKVSEQDERSNRAFPLPSFDEMIRFYSPVLLCSLFIVRQHDSVRKQIALRASLSFDFVAYIQGSESQSEALVLSKLSTACFDQNWSYRTPIWPNASSCFASLHLKLSQTLYLDFFLELPLHSVCLYLLSLISHELENRTHHI